jgi:cation transport regulator ChaC
MNHDKWYFAYGSNLLVDQKEDRTGQIRQALRARLPGYRFAFNKRGDKGQIYANIIPDESHEVWGVIYLCNPAAIKEMDKREGVSGGHYARQTVQVITDTGKEVSAETYIGGSDHLCDEGRPTDEYLNRILDGARHHGLPEEYILAIERLGTT